MARIKITLPEAWMHEYSLTVRITDVNYGGHVGSDRLLAYLQEARVDWLRKLGYPSEMLSPPIGLILVDTAIRLKAETMHGDVLTIRLAVSEWSRLGLELAYQIVRNPDGEEVARATTGFTFFDYSARKISAPPEGFRETVSGG